MDMTEAVELEDLGDQARQTLEELMEMALLRLGQILMVGCSSGEVDSFKIRSHSSTEMGVAVYTAPYQELKPKGIYPAAQCCKHLNHALILEAEAVQAYDYEPVNVVPQLKAGGSSATVMYVTLERPAAVEHIRAHVGIDIDDTLTGMHMEDVTVSVRIKTEKIGSAHVVCVRTKPKFIGGIRARYDEKNI